MIFPARFLFDWMVEDFMRILPHLLAASRPKCKLHLYKGIFRGHARHAPSLLYVFFVLAAHVEAFWAMCWPSCWPLLWTWAFQCRWVVVYSSRFPKKHRKYQANRNFWVALLMFLMFSFLFRVFPFSWGMLHLGYAGFISSSCWEKIEPCWVVVASFSAHVGPMWSHLGLCWDRVGSCC